MATKTVGILHGGKNNQLPMIAAFKDELADWVNGTGISVVYDPVEPLWCNDNPATLAANARTLWPRRSNLLGHLFVNQPAS